MTRVTIIPRTTVTLTDDALSGLRAIAHLQQYGWVKTKPYYIRGRPMTEFYGTYHYAYTYSEDYVVGHIARSTDVIRMVCR